MEFPLHSRVWRAGLLSFAISITMTSLHPGDQLDHYRIDGLVARSGMASIFRGTDLRNGRQVAIKIPHPEVESDPALFDRFHREEQIGKAFDHPPLMQFFPDEHPTRVSTALIF